MARGGVIAMFLLAACQLALPQSGSLTTARRSAPQDPAATNEAAAAPPPRDGETAAPSTPPAQEVSIEGPVRGHGLYEGQLRVPNVTGMTFEAAAAAFKKAGFTAELEPSFGLDCERSYKKMNRVDCQAPTAGTTQEPGTHLRVQLWDGRVIRALSDAEVQVVVGMTVEAAQAKMYQLAFGPRCKVMEQPQDPSCKDGHVCTIIARGGECTLVVNKAYEIAPPP